MQSEPPPQVLNGIASTAVNDGVQVVFDCRGCRIAAPGRRTHNVLALGFVRRIMYALCSAQVGGVGG
jgi:hypothetical protein